MKSLDPAVAVMTMAIVPQTDFNPNSRGPPEWAAKYRECGLQVMPCHDKVAVLPWKEFQDGLMGQEVFDGLYGQSGRFVTRTDMGMCMITGKASGGIDHARSRHLQTRRGAGHQLAQRYMCSP